MLALSFFSCLIFNFIAEAASLKNIHADSATIIVIRLVLPILWAILLWLGTFQVVLAPKATLRASRPALRFFALLFATLFLAVPLYRAGYLSPIMAYLANSMSDPWPAFTAIAEVTFLVAVIFCLTMLMHNFARRTCNATLVRASLFYLVPAGIPNHFQLRTLVFHHGNLFRYSVSQPARTRFLPFRRSARHPSVLAFSHLFHRLTLDLLSARSLAREIHLRTQDSLHSSPEVSITHSHPHRAISSCALPFQLFASPPTCPFALSWLIYSFAKNILKKPIISNTPTP